MPTIYLSEKELNALTQALEDVEHEVLRSALVKLQRAERKVQSANIRQLRKETKKAPDGAG